MSHNPGFQFLCTLFLISTLVTLVTGAATLRWHGWWHRRERALARDAERLSLSFARLLTGGVTADSLRAQASAARPEVFWRALELFSDNIAGEELERVSAQLKALAHIAREQKRLTSRSSWRRALAARHLGLLEDPGQRRALRDAMVAGPPMVTLTAALALARLDDAPSLSWLLSHPDRLPGLSRHQLLALLKRFGPIAIPPLRRVLSGPPREEPMFLAAIEAVGILEDETTRPRLEAIMQRGGLEARIACARSLGVLGTPESAPALYLALGDRDWQVRAQAAKSLGELGDAATKIALHGLVARTRDASWWVRRHSAFALGRLGRAGELALQGVAANDTDPYARDAAREVIEALAWETESPGGVSRVE